MFIYIVFMKNENIKEIQCARGDRRRNFRGRWTSSWYFTLLAEARIFLIT